MKNFGKAKLFILAAGVIGLSPFLMTKVNEAEPTKLVETVKVQIDAKAIDKCRESQNPSKLQCFEELIDADLRQNGVEAAFDTLDHLYKIDSDFASDCHSFSHTLGTKAYELFASNTDFTLSTKSSYCGYGFYHGFMETLLQTTGDINQAQDFCRYAGVKLAKATTDAEGACYHGIGHGAVDGSDPRAFGDPQKTIAPGLELCEKISLNDDMKRFRCVTGAFNALEIFMSSNQYGLSVNQAAPFKICEDQIERYKEECYTQMTVVLMRVTGNDYDKMIKIIDKIGNNDYALPTFEAIVVEKARLGLADYKNSLDYCRSIPTRFHVTCITSISEGFMKYGPPQEEYVKALDFCGSPLLRADERSECFSNILPMLRIWYTIEKSTEICKTVAPKDNPRGCQYY